MATPVKFRQVKIILAGDKDTGKHCFARRLVDNRYPRDRWTNVRSIVVLTSFFSSMD